MKRGRRTEVWSAHDVSRGGRRVAVKIARDQHDPERARAIDADLRAEAAVLAAVDHPNLLPLIELVAEPVAIVTPWFGGGTLRDLLDERGALTAGQVTALLLPLVSALDALAERGWVHGDLKPANVLLDRDGVPLLADLGSATPVAGPHDADTAHGPGPGSATRSPSTGAVDRPVRSSPAYLDPVVAETGVPSVAGDVWALGVIAYEALTGRLPHRGEPAETLALAAAGAHRHLREWPGIPGPVADVVERALAPDVADRPSHAGALVEHLRAALRADEPVELPGPTTRRSEPVATPAEQTIEVGPRLATGSGDGGDPSTPRGPLAAFLDALRRSTGGPAIERPRPTRANADEKGPLTSDG